MQPRIVMNIPESRDYVFISLEYSPGQLTDEVISTILMNVSNRIREDYEKQKQERAGNQARQEQTEDGSNSDDFPSGAV